MSQAAQPIKTMFLVPSGRCLAYGQGVTFWPLLEIEPSLLFSVESLSKRFAGQPVCIDCERDRYRRHRAGELALYPRESGKHVHAPQMHADAVCVGVIDQPVRGRIADLVFERGAEVSADRIGTMTVNENAELGVGCVSCRSARGGKDQKEQGEDSD